jgi:hypothetical protein
MKCDKPILLSILFFAKYLGESSGFSGNYVSVRLGYLNILYLDIYYPNYYIFSKNQIGESRLDYTDIGLIH